MTFAFHLLIVLFAGCFLGRYSEGFKNGMINQHMRFRRFFFPPLKGYEYIIQVKAANQRAAASDSNLFLDIYGSKGTASKLKLGNLMTFNDFQSGKTDQFKVKLRDLGEIRKITLGHHNFARKPNWYLDRITIKAHDGNNYKFICNCTIMKIKQLFPEGKKPPVVPAPGGCGGIFTDASHCWPFDDEIAEESPDLKGSSPAELEDGARIADSVARVYVASTLDKGSWINMGNFKGKCISEPNLCRTGVTMIFWANIETSEISADPATSQYVFSSGGYDRRSQGFSFFHKNNSYVLQVVNGRKKWREEIPLSRMPSDCWFSFAFTWSKAQGMRHFINGKPDGQPILQPVDANVQHVNRFHGFRISKPNSNNNIEEMMPMKIDQFVTWGKVLSEAQILQAFKEGGEASCNKGNASNLQACNPTPCFNGGTCKIDVDEPRGYRCVCPEGFAGLQCELYEEEPTQGSSTAAPTSSAPTTKASPGTSATTNVSSTAVPTATAQTTVGASSTSGTNAATTVVASTEGPTNTGGPTTAPVSTSATTLTGKPTSPGGGSAAPSTGPTSSSTTERPAPTGGSTVNPTSGESLTTAPTTKEPTGEGTKSQTSATSATPTTAKPTIVGGSTKKPTTGVISTSSPTTPGGSTNKPGTEGATTSSPSTSGVSPKTVPTTAPPVSGGPTTAGSKTAKPTAVGASKSVPTTPGVSTTKTPTTAPATTGGLTTAGGSTRKPIAGGKTTKMPTSPGASTTKSPTTAPTITGGPTTGGGSTGKPTVGGKTTKLPTSPGASTTKSPTTAPTITGGPTTGGGSTGKPTVGGKTTKLPTSPGASTTKSPTTAPTITGGPTTGGGSTGKPTVGGKTTKLPTSPGASTTKSPTTAPTITGGPTTSGGSTGKPIAGGKTTKMPTSPGASTTKSPTTAPTMTGGPTTGGGSTGKPTVVGETTKPPTPGISTKTAPTAAPPTAGGPTTAGRSTKKPTSGAQTTAIPATLGASTRKAPTTATPTSKGPTTGSSSKSSATPTTFKPTSAGSSTSSPTTIGASTATPTASGGSTRNATTIKGSSGKPTSKPTAGGETTAGTTVGGSTGIGGSTRRPTTVSTASPRITEVTGGSTPAGAPTAGGGSKNPTTAETTAAAPTTSPTLPGGSSRIPTSGGASIGGTTTISTPAPVTQPVTLQIKLEIKILINDLIQEIDNFRRLHQAPDVKLSVTLSQVANQWANKIANEGVERIDPNSNYGQLVCSHNAGGNTAKACVVKWYGAIKFFDWSNPKLTKNASPFTQLVWRNNSAIGVGVAKGGGGIKKQNVGGKNFIVVLFEPGQNDAGDIKDNVRAATGISEPDPGAACPKGYSKVPQGSRSCFKVNTTPLTWDDSIYGCALDNGSLASLQSKEEADLVVSLIRASNESEAWIGLHDSSSEGRYVWLDGSAIPFSEWLQGEPNGRTSENCIIQSKGTFLSGWADRPCSEKKAFVCEVPVPGYTNYKLSFLMTEPQTHHYQNSAYSQPFYPGSYSMCLPYIQSGNELLKETIIRYFQTKNMFVQPVINTIRCMNNGSSFLEVTVKLGPGDVSQSIESLQASIKENDGVLDLASGAKAKLVSVEILSPGVSYCPNHCTTTSCQPGCDQFCCIQSSAGHYQPQMPYQPPLQQQYQQRYQQPPYQPQQQQYHQPYQPQYQQPYPQSASYNNRGPWQCPLACTRSGSQCPAYCSPRCCKKRLRIKIHRF
ncbi:uncharacterized protein LOC114960275 [Acropora millepora]|uniref:uncharacterized protein LOC114960275 n=1 Tax=Acropora millepora TaxID=45264 RepID=UPI001CF2344E|nr:uncharacterized protein LOC114960275 [Acropora millepora]